MSKPSPLLRSSSSESLVESSSHETPVAEKQTESPPSPVMKTKTKKDDQQEAYKANASSSSTYTEKNEDIGKSFKTKIDTASESNAKKEQWAKFIKNIRHNGILVLCNLKSEEIEDLAEWLRQSASAKITGIHLDCRPNALSENGYTAAKKLAQFIQTNTSITSLAFSNSSIDNLTYKYFAEAIKANPQTKITTLELRKRSIDDKGIKVFAEVLNTNTTITTLDLSDNRIRDDGAEALFEALKLNKTITTIDLHNNKIQDKGTKALAESLKINVTIKKIDLYGNEIETEGGKALGEVLKINKIITTLLLNKNDIGDEGAIVFAEALKTNTTITTLSLFSNNISDEAGIVFAEALKINITITTLNLSGCYISIKGARALAEAMKTNVTITKLEIDSFKESGDEYKTFIRVINQQCALNAQRVLIENNIAAALDLLTAHPNPNDGNVTSVRDVNSVIAKNLFVLDKADKLNTDEARKNPNSVLNKYT